MSFNCCCCVSSNCQGAGNSIYVKLLAIFIFYNCIFRKFRITYWENLDSSKVLIIYYFRHSLTMKIDNKQLTTRPILKAKKSFSERYFLDQRTIIFMYIMFLLQGHKEGAIDCEISSDEVVLHTYKFLH